jgi:hypothetical protein
MGVVILENVCSASLHVKVKNELLLKKRQEGLRIGGVYSELCTSDFVGLIRTDAPKTIQ